jgi:hypothetical protein
VVFCGTGTDETFDECTDAGDAADKSTRLVATTNPVHHAAVIAAKAIKNRFDPDFIAGLLGAPVSAWLRLDRGTLMSENDST